MDQPDQDRKAHDKEVSRAGGIAILLSSILALTLPSIDWSPLTGLLLASCIIFVFGLIDDLLDLHYLWKFVGQFVAAGLAVYSGVCFDALPFVDAAALPPALLSIFTLLFLVMVTNAVNMSDGLDGLAGGATFLSLGLVALLSYFTQNYAITLLTVAIMGSIAGFLRFNTHPATIFMGDSGSQFIGFMTACLAILTSHEPEINYNRILPLLILGLPILDAAYVTVIRVKNGQSPFSADDSHLHHLLVRLGLKHNEAVAVYYTILLVLLSLAYTLRFATENIATGVYVLFSGFILGALVVSKRIAEANGGSIVISRDITKDERRNMLFRGIGEHYRLSVGLLSYALVGSLLLAVIATWLRAPTIDIQTIRLSVTVALVLAVLYGLAWRKQHATKTWLLRLVSSVSAAVVFFHTADLDLASGWRYALDAGLLFTLSFLALCYRISRKQAYALTTQDLLIVIVIFGLYFLPIDESIRYVIMRILIFLFVVEFLIAVQRPRYHLLNLAGILSVIVIAASGLQ